jgi:hypothetical protein
MSLDDQAISAALSSLMPLTLIALAPGASLPSSLCVFSRSQLSQSVQVSIDQQAKVTRQLTAAIQQGPAVASGTCRHAGLIASHTHSCCSCLVEQGEAHVLQQEGRHRQQGEGHEASVASSAMVHVYRQVVYREIFSMQLQLWFASRYDMCLPE